MTNAFSVLSLKRNRSTSNSKAHSFTAIEPVSKLSKLKSGFSLFSRITQSITQHHHQYQDYEHHHHHNNKRMIVAGLFQYFRSNDDHDSNKSKLYRKGTYDSDSHYEYNHYYSMKKSENNQHNPQQQMERNIHTLPTVTTKKLTGILIKRSGTNPSTIAFKHYHPGSHRNRKYSNATISNMTINSEDLTAKEFADIAGIRILPEEEEEDEDEVVALFDLENNTRQQQELSHRNQRKLSQDEDDMMNTVSSCYTTKSNDHHERLSVLSYTSLQSYSTNSKLKIWDNEFWSHPEGMNTTISRSNTTNTTGTQQQKLVNNSGNNHSLNRKVSTRSTASNKLVAEPPILHELRRMNTVNSNDSCVIKKGRFEVQLGTSTTDQRLQQDGSSVEPSTTTSSDNIITTTATANTEKSVVVENDDDSTNKNYTDSTLSFSDAQASSTASVLEWKRKGKKLNPSL